MKRWLLVAADFDSTGGMDLANLALARYLAARGDLLELVTHRVAPELAARSNVIARRIPRPLGSTMLGGPLIDRLGRMRAAGVRRDGGRVVVNGGNCAVEDVNWVHYVHAAYSAQSATGWARRTHRRIAAAVDLRQERLVVPRARLIIANSQRTAADLQRHLGIDPTRIAVVYCGVDPEAFCPPPDEQRQRVRAELGLRPSEVAFAFVGALGDRRKGFDTLFDAWRELTRRNGWDGKLFVIGQGAELARWKARAEALGAAQPPRFLGFRSDVARLLAGMDALVAPARYEPFGLGVLEALCCGLPAIVSASAGVCERYPPQLASLLLPDPEDPSALAARIEAVREQLGALRAGTLELSAELRRHSWAEMARQLVALIESR